MNASLLPVPIALVGFLYAMVGHGGASGYLAVLGLAGLDPADMRSSALCMNVCVSLVGAWQFIRAGHFRWAVLRPFLLTSVPCAFLGAGIHLEKDLYLRLLGLCVVLAGLRLSGVLNAPREATNTVPVLPALAIGAAIGLLAGMLGIGGGILLSPVLLLAGWADARVTAATSALFILANSGAGLVNLAGSGAAPPVGTGWWCLAAVLGGAAGSWVGARRAPEPRLRQALGVVLLLASVKLIWP